MQIIIRDADGAINLLPQGTLSNSCTIVPHHFLERLMI
jgi:hypothetical protein